MWFLAVSQSGHRMSRSGQPDVQGVTDEADDRATVRDDPDGGNAMGGVTRPPGSRNVRSWRECQRLWAERRRRAALLRLLALSSSTASTSDPRRNGCGNAAKRRGEDPPRSLPSSPAGPHSAICHTSRLRSAAADTRACADSHGLSHTASARRPGSVAAFAGDGSTGESDAGARRIATDDG